MTNAEAWDYAIGMISRKCGDHIRQINLYGSYARGVLYGTA